MRKGKLLVNSNKFTLDRFEGDYAIFLRQPEETEQKIIHRTELNTEVKQGDIVTIDEDGKHFLVTVLTDETAMQKDKMSSLMQKLRDKT